MPCAPEELKHVPLFGLLDDEELAVLAAQVDVKTFAPRQRIYKTGDPGRHAYILMSGNVQLTIVDDDHQEVLVDQPGHGQFFGFASMLDQNPHQTSAMAMAETVCVEISRDDIAVLLQRKPMAGMDMLTVLGQQFHASQELVRIRATRNPNDLIDEDFTFGERIADAVASFGGSWYFIILFAVVLMVYTTINIVLRGKAWDPYPFILLNLLLSLQATYAGPIVLLAGNRQSQKDRITLEHAADEADMGEEHITRILIEIKKNTGLTLQILKELEAESA
jgi:CRP/FNR family transcriptional regulator, cyclic AMP receptor protein